MESDCNVINSRPQSECESVPPKLLSGALLLLHDMYNRSYLAHECVWLIRVK